MTLRKKIQGKHIKHSPNIKLQTETQFNSTFLVKSSTPYISALKKISKMLSKFEKSKNLNNLNSSNYNKKYQNENYKKVKYITVKGMGKTIEKTLKIAMNYQNDQNYKVDILTGSVQVLDEFEKSHTSQIDSIEDAVDNTICTKDSIEENHFDGPEREYQKRMVSYVEARVWLKRE